jgi:hypothetical protein
MPRLSRRPMSHGHGHAVAAALIAALATVPVAAAPTPSVKAAPAAAVRTPAASPVDAELLLRGCGGEAQRNAKLYVARAHGIELMKRSADRDQGRSMLRIEAQLDGMLQHLRGKGGSVEAELDRMEEALIGLTELTLQQPVVSQVEAALRLADRAADSCAAAMAKVGLDKAASTARWRQLGAMLHSSQRLAGQFLAASLKAGGPSTAETAALARLAAAYDSDLGLLRAGSVDDASLREALTLLDGQWLFVRTALSRPRENARSKIEDVGRASEIIFELLDAQLQRLRRSAGAGTA